jgi:hypothetical protein
MDLSSIAAASICSGRATVWICRRNVLYGSAVEERPFRAASRRKKTGASAPGFLSSAGGEDEGYFAS